MLNADALWILLVGALVATNGALVGSFLVLRRMALVGDAISHAVLPGIVLAFLVAGSRAAPVMLIGATTVGVLCTLAIEWLHARGRLATDAAIGISFTGLFALGLVLLAVFAGSVDLDQDCVLYGEIAYVPIDTYFTASGQSLGPRAVWHLAPVLLLTLLVVVIGYRPLALSTFDAAYATSVGVKARRWHLVLMTLTSLTTVAAFEAVGAILVVAFLVAPAAAALLLAKRLPQMLLLAVGASWVATAGGYGLATAFDVSIAGSMAVVAGLLVGLAVLFSPSQGLLRRPAGLPR
jgi:manganese/zinc/iron transport system permease protein